MQQLVTDATSPKFFWNRSEQSIQRDAAASKDNAAFPGGVVYCVKQSASSYWDADLR